MKTFFKSIARAALLASLALFVVQSVRAQATTMVAPRQYVLFTGSALGSHGYLGTNAAQPTVTPGFTNVYASTNTLIPFSGAHAIGLTFVLGNSNVFAAASNIVVTVYPAYDTGGGNATTIGQRYGTNFSPSPLLVWTLSNGGTNSAGNGWVYTAYTTNLPTTTWEPATALGFTVTNTTGSNLVASLTMSVAP